MDDAPGPAEVPRFGRGSKGARDLRRCWAEMLAEFGPWAEDDLAPLPRPLMSSIDAALVYMNLVPSGFAFDWLPFVERLKPGKVLGTYDAAIGILNAGDVRVRGWLTTGPRPGPNRHDFEVGPRGFSFLMHGQIVPRIRMMHHPPVLRLEPGARADDLRVVYACMEPDVRRELCCDMSNVFELSNGRLLACVAGLVGVPEREYAAAMRWLGPWAERYDADDYRYDPGWHLMPCHRDGALSRRRTVDRTRVIERELIAAAWHPGRFATWCLDSEELASLRDDIRG